MVNDISSLSRYAPLTPDQSVRCSESWPMSAPVSKAVEKADPKTIDWSQVQAQAHGVLTETQITALKAEAPTPPADEAHQRVLSEPTTNKVGWLFILAIQS